MIVIAGKWLKRRNFFIGLFIGIMVGFFGRVFSSSMIDLIRPSAKSTFVMFISSIIGLVFLVMILWVKIPEFCKSK